MIKYLHGLLLTAAFLLLLYCSDGGLSPDQRSYIIPENNISYYDDLLPMLEGKCGFECHSNNVEITTIPFQVKEEFMDFQISVNGDVLVNIFEHENDPQRAPLYRLVTEFDYLGDRDVMPPLSLGRAPLTENQINGIKQWIFEGAAD